MNRRAHLSKLLERHAPFTELEAAHLAGMRDLCAVPGDPFDRAHWEPGHFTASAFVLSPDEQSVLLILHGKLKRWLQPGGHVDPEDADIVAAAMREVAEETGVTEVDVVGDGLFDVDVHVLPARKGDPEHRHFDARILLRARTLDFAAGSDAEAGKWVPLDDVSAVESDDSVMRAVDKIRSLRG
ncbi:MAG: NUDIX hydrolase [Proteobacteria bacterium]|nr:NUDIX hydrolase [Pseudomonadota bacterium]